MAPYDLLKAFRGYNQTLFHTLLTSLRSHSLTQLKHPHSPAEFYMKRDSHDRAVVKREVRRRKLELFGHVRPRRCVRCRILKISCYTPPRSLKGVYTVSRKCTHCLLKGTKCEDAEEAERVVDLSGEVEGLSGAEAALAKINGTTNLRRTRRLDRRHLYRQRTDNVRKHGLQIPPPDRLHDYGINQAVILRAGQGPVCRETENDVASESSQQHTEEQRRSHRRRDLHSRRRRRDDAIDVDQHQGPIDIDRVEEVIDVDALYPGDVNIDRSQDDEVKLLQDGC